MRCARETDADIAITNGGGIRGGRIYPAGTAITRRDIMAELPFGNTIAVLDISGERIRAGLENGFSYLPRAAGRFPQVSGLTIVVDPSRPVGQRVMSVDGRRQAAGGCRRSTGSRPTISWHAAATATRPSTTCTEIISPAMTAR